MIGFFHGRSQSDVKKDIKQRGGIIVESITKQNVSKVDYVICGDSKVKEDSEKFKLCLKNGIPTMRERCLLQCIKEQKIIHVSSFYEYALKTPGAKQYRKKYSKSKSRKRNKNVLNDDDDDDDAKPSEPPRKKRKLSSRHVKKKKAVSKKRKRKHSPPHSLVFT